MAGLRLYCECGVQRTSDALAVGYDGTNRVNDIFLAEQLGELRCPFLSRERYEKSRFVGEEGKEIKNSMQQRKVYLQKAPN